MIKLWRFSFQGNLKVIWSWYSVVAGRPSGAVASSRHPRSNCYWLHQSIWRLWFLGKRQPLWVFWQTGFFSEFRVNTAAFDVWEAKHRRADGAAWPRGRQGIQGWEGHSSCVLWAATNGQGSWPPGTCTQQSICQYLFLDSNTDSATQSSDTQILLCSRFKDDILDALLK